MAMEGILKNRNGKLYVLHTYDEFSEPFRQFIWWRVLEARGSGYGECPEAGDIATSAGSGQWKTRNPATQRSTGSVSIGIGSTQAETVERVSINPPPAGGKELRWRDGRWEKLMAKGWVPAGEGKGKVPKKSAANHSTARRHHHAQLDREIAEALKPQLGRYDDRPDAWQHGYDFARASALHETRTEQREILRRVSAGPRSAYDRGFVAGYQDMLGVPRSSSIGRAVLHRATKGKQKSPSFKISTKDPASMTAAEINKELDKLNEQDSTLGSLMIETGRGYERPSAYLKMTDPLALELRKNSDRRQALRIEISARYGPNPPSRLPSGRGFGPRAKMQ